MLALHLRRQFNCCHWQSRACSQNRPSQELEEFGTALSTSSSLSLPVCLSFSSLFALQAQGNSTRRPPGSIFVGHGSRLHTYWLLVFHGLKTRTDQKQHVSMWPAPPAWSLRTSARVLNVSSRRLRNLGIRLCRHVVLNKPPN